MAYPGSFLEKGKGDDDAGGGGGVVGCVNEYGDCRREFCKECLDRERLVFRECAGA